MTCKPLYLAAERAYVCLNEMQCLIETPELRSTVRAVLGDLHEALGLDEEPTQDWWKSTLNDRALDDKLNRKHGLD